MKLSDFNENFHPSVYFLIHHFQKVGLDRAYIFQGKAAAAAAATHHFRLEQKTRIKPAKVRSSFKRGLSQIFELTPPYLMLDV